MATAQNEHGLMFVDETIAPVTTSKKEMNKKKNVRLFSASKIGHNIL